MADPVDTTNTFIVGRQGDLLTVMRPVSRLTEEEALNLAAYLVALSEQSFEDFTKVYESICNA